MRVLTTFILISVLAGIVSCQAQETGEKDEHDPTEVLLISD